MAPGNAAESEDVELDPQRKRDILELEAALDRMNHFEVLGLEPGASEAEVKKAYHEASLRYHPDRYFQKQLGSFRGRIERIFKRLTEASSTLTDPKRRKEYQRMHPELFRPPPSPSAPPSEPETPRAPMTPEQAARAEERRRRLIQHPYLAKAARFGQFFARGKVELEKGDYHKASTDLQMASAVAPDRKEVKSLLDEARRKDHMTRGEREAKRGKEAESNGDLQSAANSYCAASDFDQQNASLAEKAATTLQRIGEVKRARIYAHRAMMLDPTNVNYRLQLAGLLLEAGMKKAAKAELEEALKIQPENPEAKKQLKKLRWSF
jgi:curved DNA-binding protein CbpA